METQTSIEKHRLTIQKAIDAKRTPVERNRSGQFATPTELALDILKYSKGLLPSSKKIRFLDPAIGSGSFFSALLANYTKKRIEKAQGVELDPLFASSCKKIWRNSNLTGC